MRRIEKIGRDRGRRALCLLELDEVGDLPEGLDLPSSRFVLLLAWDATDAPVATIAGLAEAVLRQGAVYVCCWGPDCERVHDIVDECDLERNPDDEDLWVMTTWHADESLDDALWFALFTARPPAPLDRDCRALLALTIGRPDAAARIRQAFRDPKAFDDEVMARE